MVSVITCTIRSENMDNVFDNYAQQAFKQKELIIILNRDDMDLSSWEKKAKRYPDVSVYQVPGIKSLGECQNFAVSKATHNHIAKFDDDDYYAPLYLSEIMHAFKKTNADLVGKSQYYAYVPKFKSLVLREAGPENKFVTGLRGPTIAAKKDVFKQVQWPKITNGVDKVFQKDCLKKGYKFYSTSKFNFTYMKKSSENHTWKISEDEFLKKCKFVCYTDDYKKIVTKRDDH